jgi:hypothetical protein
MTEQFGGALYTRKMSQGDVNTWAARWVAFSSPCTIPPLKLTLMWVAVAGSKWPLCQNIVRDAAGAVYPQHDEDCLTWIHKPQTVVDEASIPMLSEDEPSNERNGSYNSKRERHDVLCHGITL